MSAAERIVKLSILDMPAMKCQAAQLQIQKASKRLSKVAASTRHLLLLSYELYHPSFLFHVSVGLINTSGNKGDRPEHYHILKIPAKLSLA